VTRDAIDDAMAETGCRLINVIPPSESHPGQSIYATRERTGFLFLVEDGRLGAVYLTAQGEHPDRDLEAIRALLPCYGTGELEADVSDCEDEAALARGLGLLVLSISGEPSDQQVHILRRSLVHSSPVVRCAALVALAYVPWPALADDVAALAADDDEPVVRLHAQQLLAALRA
jgi:hypothetical protein